MSDKRDPRTGLGLVQLYTGDGKGKTTAALGLALRAAGRGYRVFIGQFMKAQDCGELHSLEQLAPQIVVEQFGRPEFVIGPAQPEDVAAAQRGLARIREALASGAYQVVIWDEVCVALHFNLLDLADVLAALDERPVGVEVVLTGRRAPQELLDRADLATEMRPIKHPYERGIPARRGIED